MRLDSGSLPRQTKWRLTKTLKRKSDFRPIEADDIKFIWAAYKQGALKTMGGKFADTEMSADQFKTEFEQAVIHNFHAAWILFAPTKKGSIPVGVVFATWAPNAPFMIVNGMCWFPWSSTRNKIESAVAFLNSIRKELSLMFYALPEHKRMYEVCMMHGIVRRIGTSFTAIPGSSAAVFETRGTT